MKKDIEEKDYSSIMNVEGVSGIVRYLADHGEAKQVHLKSIIPNHYRLSTTMEEMKEAGLIEIEFQTSPKKIYRYWLTEKGKLIAKKLEEIEQILSNA